MHQRATTGRSKDFRFHLGRTRVGVVMKRFDVLSWWLLDPTLGSEIKKTRPCVIVSPDESNRHLATVIVAPMTTKGRDYPTRVACRFPGQTGPIVLDQLRTVDKVRSLKRSGQNRPDRSGRVLATLAADVRRVTPRHFRLSPPPFYNSSFARRMRLSPPGRHFHEQTYFRDRRRGQFAGQGTHRASIGMLLEQRGLRSACKNSTRISTSIRAR